MPTGLLADLVLMMSSSPEDVATRALELLLARSPAGRATMDRLLNGWRSRSGVATVRWVSQVVGEDGGRTDLEGHGPGDTTLAILESKFWAGLTVNQPTTYLDRLPATDGILVFVAPAKRVPLLAYELGLRLTPPDNRHDAFTAAGGSHVAHLASIRKDVGRHLMDGSAIEHRHRHGDGQRVR